MGRDRYTVRWGDVVTDQALRQEMGGAYDVVVANIVADVIKALASTVRPLVKRRGHLPVLRHHRRPGGGGGPAPAG